MFKRASVANFYRYWPALIDFDCFSWQRFPVFMEFYAYCVMFVFLAEVHHLETIVHEINLCME